MQKMTVMALPKSVIDFMENPAMETKPRRIWEKMSLNLGEKCHQYFWLHLLALLLGRLTILGDLAPFGLGFFAATAQIAKERAYGVGAATLLGVLSAGRYEEAGIYLFCMLVYFKMEGRLTRIEKKMFAVPIGMFFSFLVGGICLNYLQDAALYAHVVVFFNALLCMIASHLFTYGMPLLLNRSVVTSTYEKPANETMVCFVVILALAIAGVGNLVIFGYHVQNIFSSVLVMVMALAGGAGLGAAVGVVVGTVIGLSGGNSNAVLAIALYAVSGVMAGVVQSLGKFAVLLGFIFGSMIIHLGFTQLPLLMESVTEVIIAALILLALPLGNMVNLQKNLAFGIGPTVQPDYILAEGSYKLQSIAEMFYELAGILGLGQADVQEKNRQKELTNLLSAVGVQICETCSNRTMCWEENYYRTYQNLLAIFNELNYHKPLQGKDMPLEFREDCINAGKMVEIINAAVEKNHINAYWQNKVSGQKQTMSEQMKAMGNIISNLAQELNKKTVSNINLANLLRHKALQIGCPIENVKVTGKEKPRQIDFEKIACGKAGDCATSLLPLFAGTLQERMTLLKKCGNRDLNTKCKLCMKVASCFQIKTAVATIAKEGKEVCGDSIKITPLNRGKVSLVLSDGMGIGKSAEKESKLTVNCLSKLLQNDFDIDVAVKTVNSLLLLQATGEKFATVDMAVVDKYTGEAEFLKVASAPSFVKRVREVKTINAAALPIGILNQVEIQPIKMQLAVNDVLIMVSDGIADSKDVKLRSDDKEGWLINFLRRSDEKDEQKFAEAILEEAVRLSGGKAKDDMTVLVMILGEAGLI